MTTKVPFWCSVYLMVTAVMTVVLTYHEFNKYYKLADRRMLSSYMATRKESAIKCCLECEVEENCHSAGFKETTKECQLSRVPGVLESTETSGDWVIFSKTDWFLVFRGFADIGKSIYESWMLGTSVTTTNEDCLQTSHTNCSKHYRSTLVDEWENLGVKLVRFAVYKDGHEVAYIIFDGANSTYTSWFSISRVVESTWTDLYTTTTLNEFSISGIKQRQFYISLLLNGCPEDITIFAVISDSKHRFCNYDIHTNYPKLLYSTTNRWAKPGTGIGIDYADFMTISIKTQM